MNVLIVYDSKFGNTERIARAIAGRLGSARLIRAEEVGALGRTECDLLIVAGSFPGSGQPLPYGLEQTDTPNCLFK